MKSDLIIKPLKLQRAVLPLSAPECFGATTFERSSREKVALNAEQYKEICRLHQDYGISKPGWLRREFKLTRLRASYLAKLLYEAGLDGVWCGYCEKDGWDAELHKVWHIVKN